MHPPAVRGTELQTGRCTDAPVIRRPTPLLTPTGSPATKWPVKFSSRVFLAFIVALAGPAAAADLHLDSHRRIKPAYVEPKFRTSEMERPQWVQPQRAAPVFQKSQVASSQFAEVRRVNPVFKQPLFETRFNPASTKPRETEFPHRDLRTHPHFVVASTDNTLYRTGKRHKKEHVHTVWLERYHRGEKRVKQDFETVE